MENRQQVAQLVNSALQAYPQFNALGFDKRHTLLQSWATELSKIAILSEFAQPLQTLLQNQLSSGSKMIKDNQLLAGPTGESNELYCSGRGVFILISDSLLAMAAQITTALLAGNAIIIIASKNNQAKLLHNLLITVGLNTEIAQLAENDLQNLLIENSKTAGVAITSSDQNELIAINRQLAMREGLIAQLISEQDITHLSTIKALTYSLRFITERTRSINLTAVGGDAKLLALGCGD